MAASPSSVISLGLGDWGTPSLVITLGYGAGAPVVTATITGTLSGGATESQIVIGGLTIIITLTDGVWVASGASFDAIRQDIIDGLDSDGAEPTGWNTVVRDTLAVGTVVRTSDTVATITLPAFGSYDISSAETVTVTVPASAIDSYADPVIGVPTFAITPVAPPTPVVEGGGGGGGGWMRAKRGKKRALFDDIEATLRETLLGPTEPEPDAPAAAPPPRAVAAERVDAALRALTEIAEENENLTARVAAIRKAVAEYEARVAEEEDEAIIMSLL